MANPVKTPLPPGLVARLVSGVRYVVTGASDAWMGPNQPLPPTADSPSDETRGRAFDYRVGINLDTVPKTPEAGISYDLLRGLADGYDLVRLCIETRKDQISAQEWQFKIKGDDKATDPRLDDLMAFFQSPDRMNSFDIWCRLLLEEMLVIDAATVYPRMTRGGQPFAFEPLDGSTIKRVIDGYGRTPMTPEPAYQQILKGLPAVDYTLDELIYRPRNPRVYKLYGFSPVEQIVTTVNIALRRQITQLDYYTNGNVPNALVAAPEAWTPDMISQFQDWWDSITTQETKQRARFIPGGMSFIDTKQAAMGPSDQVVNEWLARVVCFAFNISPTQLVSMNNRATSDSQKEQAEDEGLKPTKRWLKQLIDEIVVRYFGHTDIEFQWVTEKELDGLKAAQINQIYLQEGVLTPDEVRTDLGLDPLTPEQKDDLLAAKPQPLPPPTPAPQPTAPNGASPGEKEKSETIHIHMPEIKTGDTLVEVGSTVVKFENADGSVRELRDDRA